MSGYNSPIAIHPGETLKEFLDGLSMTEKQLSEKTGLTSETIKWIIKGKGSITRNIALKFAIVFKTSQSFWNNL